MRDDRELEICVVRGEVCAGIGVTTANSTPRASKWRRPITFDRYYRTLHAALAEIVRQHFDAPNPHFGVEATNRGSLATRISETPFP
jgi:hypothetical protein